MENKLNELKKICQQRTDLNQERLNFELGQIEKRGLVDEFYNLYKQKKQGKENKINSLIAFALEITSKQPEGEFKPRKKIKSARIAPPDIDLDFSDRRRDEVIDYVSQKYGRDRVAQIITFGTMAARAAIRDVGRAMGVSYSFCDRIAKTIPFGSTLDETLEKVSEFRQLYETNENARKLIDFSKKLEGVARHASTHACGVVISSEPLENIVPLQNPTQNDKAIVTQYEMHSIEDLGLLKMDFLGLKNLTIIEDTLSRIYMVQNKKIKIDEIPFDDKKTYKLLQQAQTTGVFQMESEGFKRYLKELKPTTFEDIVAMIALYRPGPIQFIPEYIARANKKRKIEYLHPKLEPILEKTQGICIFQEQLMQIAQVLAGFTLSEADVLRKAVGKKIKSLLVSQKEKFIQGMIKNKIEKKVADKIWDWILPFASYGFNRSHSVAYGIIAYQTAFLKAHFPIEFMAALLTSEKVDVERTAFLIDECKNMGIEVLPPDINESFRNFSVIPGKDKIRFGLLAIKNVGSNVVEAIIQERKKNGTFSSFSEFVSRIDTQDLNKKSLESLVKSGVFDKFEERNKLLENLEDVLKLNRDIRKLNYSNQKNLFEKSSIEIPSFRLKETKPASLRQKLLWEKELLGLYISSHPLEEFKKILEKKTLPLKELKENIFSQKIIVGGIISSIKKILTKKGQPMLFLKLEDLTDKTEVVVFPAIIERNPEVLQENKIVFVQGRVDNGRDTPKIIAESIEEILEK